MQEIRTCPVCKNEFTVKFKCRKTIFCSKSCSSTGEYNSSWKGDKVGKVQVHTWVEKALGRPDRCSKCGNVGKVDLANISQEYKRDLDDWEWLCRKCHMESDGRLEKFLSHSNKFNKVPDMNCLKCGSQFTPKSNKRKFCSKSCSATYINLNQRDYSNRKSAWIKRRENSIN